jgi:hypothetical protein
MTDGIHRTLHVDEVDMMIYGEIKSMLTPNEDRG